MESRETVKSPDSRWTRDLFIATTAPTTTPGATHKTGSQPARGFITKKKGDEKMKTYERNFTDLKAAQECRKITGGKIFKFWSIDEDGQPIMVYSVRYQQKF